MLDLDRDHVAYDFRGLQKGPGPFSFFIPSHCTTVFSWDVNGWSGKTGFAASVDSGSFWVVFS